MTWHNEATNDWYQQKKWPAQLERVPGEPLVLEEGLVMLNCHKATRLISESQERTLSLQERLALKIHVMMCTGCSNFSLQVPFLGKAMRAYSRGEDEKASG